MPKKIIVDAGHGGVEPGASYEGRQEKNDTLNLALAVGQILQDNGFNVAYTRTTDIYNSPYEKATIANNSGADFLVSIHRNSSEQPNSYSGVQTLVFDNFGTKVRLAENMNDNLQKVGFTNLGVEERPNLIVLKNTKIPAVLVEAGFINNDKDNELFDNKFYEIANAIAEGIIDTVKEMEKEEPIYYKVQVGQFISRDNALRLLNQLQGEGYPVFMTYENGFYKVQVGAFVEMQNAIRMEAKLRKNGYNTFITT